MGDEAPVNILAELGFTAETAPSQEQIDEAWSKFDADEDDTLTWHETIAFLKELTAVQGTKFNMVVLNKWWQAHDKDEDGAITKEEFNESFQTW